MELGQMGAVDQHCSYAILDTTVVLCFLASRYTGYGSEHELVLDDVCRCACHRHGLLLLQGSTCLRGTCCFCQTRSLKTAYDAPAGFWRDARLNFGRLRTNPTGPVFGVRQKSTYCHFANRPCATKISQHKFQKFYLTMSMQRLSSRRFIRQLCMAEVAVKVQIQ